jgi:iron complex outermembrane receptor protein
VPLSVAVVSGDQLRAFQAGGDDILSLSGRVPSLYAETTTGRIFPRFYIRGLGNIDFYLGASQPVSIIQDDVVLEHVVLKSNPVFDVRRSKCCAARRARCSAATPPPASSSSTRSSRPRTFEGRGQSSYGSYNTVTFDAGVGGPIVDKPDRSACRRSTSTATTGSTTPSGRQRRRHRRRRRTRWAASTRRTSAPAAGHPDRQASRCWPRLTPATIAGTSTLFLRQALTKGSNSADRPARPGRLRRGDNNPQAYNT